jgi:hypothetical protein
MHGRSRCTNLEQGHDVSGLCAVRMRGIGNAQTYELFVIPEVMRLIDDQRRHIRPVAPLSVPT